MNYVSVRVLHINKISSMIHTHTHTQTRWWFSSKIMSNSCDPMDPPLCMGFSRQEYWSGLPFPSAGDLPDPGIEPASLTLAGRLLPLCHLGTSKEDVVCIYKEIVLSHKKRTNNAICSNMDGHTDCHTERSKSDTKR